MSEVAARRDPELLGAKGARTRAALIQAGRSVFERKGYFDSTLADVTTEAGVAAGTLYTYFTNREELLSAIVEDAYAGTVQPTHSRPVEVGDPVERIVSGNHEYVRAFRRNRGLNKILDEARHLDPAIRALRKERGEAFFARNAETIRRLQAAGRVEADVDSALTARSLGLMVSRHCHYVFVDPGDPSLDTEEGVDKLARLLTSTWLRAIGINPRDYV